MSSSSDVYYSPGMVV